MAIAVALRLLLDTNVILGVLKGSQHPAIVERLSDAQSDECAYSANTRIELLGFPGMTGDEDAAVRDLLGNLAYLPVTRQIEDEAIAIRRGPKKVKLPDALILATTHAHSLRLVTLDDELAALAGKP